MFSLLWLLCRGLLWHLLVIYKSLALLQIVSHGEMDFTSLPRISRSTEKYFLFLVSGLLLAVPTITVIRDALC
jgi:hypothetical protein